MAPLDTWERRLGITEWEPRKMTICIAAACDNGKAIVLAGDERISRGFTSTKYQYGKVSWLSLINDLYIMIAGAVPAANEVMTLARKNVAELSSFASYDVGAAVERAYRRVRMAKAEGEYLANRGLTLAEFYKSGWERLGEMFVRADSDIAKYDLGATLLVAGFTEDGPTIFTVRNPGILSTQTQVGFWCIGSGATAAQMSLFSRNYAVKMTVEEAAYYVYEAKIAAQSATDVGTDTDIFLIRRGYQPTSIVQPSFDVLREIIDELKPREFSKKHQEKLAQLDEFRTFAGMKSPGD